MDEDDSLDVGIGFDLLAGGDGFDSCTNGETLFPVEHGLGSDPHA